MPSRTRRRFLRPPLKVPIDFCSNLSSAKETSQWCHVFKKSLCVCVFFFSAKLLTWSMQERALNLLSSSWLSSFSGSSSSTSMAWSGLEMIGGNSIQLSRCCQEQKIFNDHSKAIHSKVILKVICSSFYMCTIRNKVPPKKGGKLPIKMRGKKCLFVFNHKWDAACHNVTPCTLVKIA